MMGCSLAYNMLGFFAVTGGLLALYVIDRDIDNAPFYLTTGLLPIASAGIAATGMLSSCTLNILNAGSASLLILAVLGMAHQEGHL